MATPGEEQENSVVWICAARGALHIMIFDELDSIRKVRGDRSGGEDGSRGGKVMFHGQTTASYGIPLADAATAHNEPKGSFGSTCSNNKPPQRCTVGAVCE